MTNTGSTNPAAISGKPILDIPPWSWAHYAGDEWYMWGDGVEFIVNYALKAWRWSIQSMINPGNLIAFDMWPNINSEANGYPDKWAAMDACYRYWLRTRPGAPVDPQGRALIARNVRLIGDGR